MNAKSILGWIVGIIIFIVIAQFEAEIFTSLLADVKAAGPVVYVIVVAAFAIVGFVGLNQLLNPQ